MTQQSSLVNQLDVTVISQTSRTRTGPIGHDDNLFRAIFYYNCWLNWVEIWCNIGCFILLEVLSFPQLLMHHLETIGIIPKVTFGIEIFKRPVNNNIFAKLFLRKLIKIEFLQLWKYFVYRNTHSIYLEWNEVTVFTQFNNDWEVSTATVRKIELTGRFALVDLDGLEGAVWLTEILFHSKFVETLALSIVLFLSYIVTRIDCEDLIDWFIFVSESAIS